MKTQFKLIATQDILNFTYLGVRMNATTVTTGERLFRVRMQGKTHKLLVLRKALTTKLFEVHPLVDRFNEEHGTAVKVISPRVADHALTTERRTWMRLLSGSPFLVDASIAYGRAGVKLGTEIVFAAMDQPRVVMPTGRYHGEKNIALACLGLSGNDFVIDGRTIILHVSDDRLIPVANFPRKRGWYPVADSTFVPSGVEVQYNPSARFTMVLTDSSYVGLMGRDMAVDRKFRGIIAGSVATNKFGIVVDVPVADLEKVRRLIENK